MSDSALLLVDDERPILNALKRLLRKEPYRLVTAEGGEAALEILEETTVQVVVSDFRMPGMSGIEMLREVKHRFPNTVRCVLSGYADGRVIMDSINVGEVYRFLPKPWNDEELMVTLRQCFAQHRLLSENERLIEQVRSQNEELQEMNDLLEQAVDQRTRSLQLSQEILEKLPMPVLGVSRDGMIVLVNGAVDRIVPAGCPNPLGLLYEDVLPAEMAEKVEAILDGREPAAVEKCTMNGDDYILYIRMLNEGGDLRGCTLILDPIYHDDFSYSLSSDSAAC